MKDKPMEEKIWTAEQLALMIEKKYPTATLNDYNPAVIFRQVANGVGWDVDRWIDVAVFQLWKTKGMTRSAFEIKVTRHDFLRELKQAEKHAWVQEAFHEFWFVAPEDIIQVEELPVGAGFMYPRGDNLCIKRHAARNPNPKIDENLLASFLRSAYKSMKASHEIDEKQVLATSKDYQRAKIYEEAVTSFLNSRQIYLEPKDRETILKCLRESTMDSEMKAERDHLLALLDDFQSDLRDAVSSFLVISSKALLEKDKLGHFLLYSYGANDKMAIQLLQDRKAGRKPPEWQADQEKLGDLIRESGSK